jgi:hypothetical protein
MQNTIGNKKSFYDQTVVIDSDIVSIVKLVLYTPIGLIVLAVRLIALLVLYLLALVFPDFTTTSSGFVRALLIAFGLHVTCDENTDDSTTNKSTILIANHVSCFDYLAIKSIYANKMTLIRLNEDDDMCTRILYPGLNNCPKKRDKHEDIDIGDQLTARPDQSINRFLYFPENARTNGKFGLLNFNFDPFSSIIVDSDGMQSIEFSPVCIGHRRLFISNLSNHADNLTNILITLFSPLTQITVKQLAVEDKQADESLNDFAMRIQAKIGTYLQLKCTNVSNDAVLVLDNGLNKLVMQVKSVLPHLNENLIKTFISTSESMDIDTLITNMLDKYAHIAQPDTEASKSTIACDNRSSRSCSDNNKNNKQPSASHASQVVKRVITYQERKHILLEEARSRFLQRCFQN